LLEAVEVDVDVEVEVEVEVKVGAGVASDIQARVEAGGDDGCSV
jgi:hypothetical protein